MTQISLASQEVSQAVLVWFYKQGSMTEKSGASKSPRASRSKQ